MAGGIRKRIFEFYRIQKNRLKCRKQMLKASFRNSKETKGLTVYFATLCIVDLFGVFPIIALPSALILCGFYGIPLMILVITLQIYTAVILGRCWTIAEKLDPTIILKNRYPYAAVAELIYGKYMRQFVTVLLDITVFGGGVPNLLVASQNLQLLGHRVSNGHFYFSFCYWLILIGLFMCPIMWLGSPKNMKALASVSVFTCSIVSILVWISILASPTNNDDEAPTNNLKKSYSPFQNLLKAYGIIAFQFDIHPMLMTIQVDMQEQQQIGKAVCYGILSIITCFMSITTTLVSAFKYGTATTTNILEMLPKSNVLYVAIMLVTLQLCLSSAVGSSALFQNIEDSLKIQRKMNFKRCLVRSILVAFAVLIGELIPKFDLIMGIIGGSLTGPLIFILPPLFYTKIRSLEKNFYNAQRINFEDADDCESGFSSDSKQYGTFLGNDISNKYNITHKSKLFSNLYSRCRCILICKFFYSNLLLSCIVVLFGLVATIASTYVNIFNLANVNQFWSPCINNISYSFIEL